jgi:hypothetical protein
MIADVLFMADHFVMVTTVDVDYSPDHRDVERQAWDRLGAEYGIDWVGMTKQFIKQVSIEVVPGTSADEQNIPTPGDITDTSTEGE